MNELVSTTAPAAQLFDRARRILSEPRPAPDRTGVRDAAAQDRLRTELLHGLPNSFEGYAFDPAEPMRRHVVQLLVDGLPMQLAVADQYDAALARQSVGDGCYGFSFTLSPEVLNDATVIEARLANTDVPVGKPLRVSQGDRARPSRGRHGVRWIGGLRFVGWLDAAGGEGAKGAPREAPRVCALIDGAAVIETIARAWHHLEETGQHAIAVPAFDLTLPDRFADGRVRTVRIVNEMGEDLCGSPLTFVAFADGLEQAIAEFAEVRSEQLRGEVFDRLIPASLPMARYAAWCARFPPLVPAPVDEPVGVVFIDDDEQSVRSLEAQSHANWVAATLPAAGSNVSFNCAQLEAFLKRQAAGCEVFVFAAGGLQLEPHALASLAAACRDNPSSRAVYADFCLRGKSGELWPVLLSAFDYERMLEQGCGALLFATSRAALETALTARPSGLFHLFQALAEDPSCGRAAVLHLPGSLGSLPDTQSPARADALAAATAAHLKARGVAAEVVARPEGVLPAVRVIRRVARGSVSIVIPTRNHTALLRRCIETIMPAVRRTDAEIIVVDNDSAEPEALDYLASIDGKLATVLRAAGFFNFARLNNLAAAAARGDHLLLLNNDIEARDDVWLDDMLGRMAEPDVGAVGATLLWPTGVVQHGGVVLGPSLGAAHAFTDRMHDDGGYAGMLTVAHECSAVTAACLLTRKADYLAVGGMDELNFPVNFNDVDYCLKLRAIGRRIVVSPHARLLHLESASRGSDQRPDRAARMQRELRALRARWLETIVDDPYYNPLLSLDPVPFSALAWPPRSAHARFNVAPRPVAIPPGM